MRRMHTRVRAKEQIAIADRRGKRVLKTLCSETVVPRSFDEFSIALTAFFEKQDLILEAFRTFSNLLKRSIENAIQYDRVPVQSSQSHFKWSTILILLIICPN